MFSFFDEMYIKIPMLFLASMGISSAFNVLYIFSPQYYPTNIRALAISFFSLSNRIAACFVPVFLNMFKNVIFFIGILSGIGAFVVFFLPEVLGFDAGAEVGEKKIVRQLSKTKRRKSTASSLAV